jgi:hypothetical protein
MVKKRVETESQESLKNVLLKDPAFTTYRRVVKTIETTLDLDKYYRECIGMHDSRLSRTLTGVSVSPAQLSQAVRQDASFRARYTKIRVQLTNQAGALEETMKTMRRHFQVKYHSRLEHLGTKGERSDYMNRYLNRGDQLKARMETIITCIDLLIKDVDQVHWQMSIALTCIELLYGKAARKEDI